MNATRKFVLVPIEKYEKFANRDTEEVREPPLDKDLVIDTIPKLYKNKARALLSYIQQSNVMGWNAMGELAIEGQVVAHSHIADLIKHAMRVYVNFNPVGTEPFYSGLAKINIPEGILGNQDCQQDVRQLKSNKKWVCI